MDLGRNLETIRRQSGQWQERSLVGEADESLVRRQLLAWLPPMKIQAVTELGLDQSALARIEEASAHGVRYQGYDRRPGVLAAARAKAKETATTQIDTLPLGAELPLPRASQDLFLSLFTLERLRMDELYMTIAEMRRIVKPGAYAALASLHPGRTLSERLAAKFYAKLGRGAPLQLSHYLSPEDWDPVRDEILPLGGQRVAGLMLLRRQPDPT